ncbi:leucine-rich repeat domain-containing protein [Neolewinella agarilytica]|uniref:leucine-rich repeat domain-containing protein n=1 Tax=Neolewinella agarilytica TaxID=478744 RepID=UPI002354FBDF|nr:leucine-rich repeat domain-containing protein [Neolewinella agarilytica]
MHLTPDFLSDPTAFTGPERDIHFCLEAEEYTLLLQRLIEELDPTDKREKLVRPRFAGAVLERLFQQEKLEVPPVIAAIAGLPHTPEDYRYLPRLMAKMTENAMMGLQVSADEAWVAEGIEIEMQRLLKDTTETYSETELAFFRLRARGNYNYYAKAYLSSWKAFQDAEQLLPGRLTDHPLKKRTETLVQATTLGLALQQRPVKSLTPEQEAEREAFMRRDVPAGPPLAKLEVNNPTGRLTIQDSYGVLIEDANESYLEEAFEHLPADSVQRLELRFCRLPGGKLPRVFYRFPNLTHLTIDSCGLSRLGNSLAAFKRLRHLRIINAPKLDSLPLKIGGLTDLQSLHIESTGIDDIPYSVLDCKSLKKLSIINSRLTYLNGFLGELPQLLHADFHHNHIDEVEIDFMDAIHLRTLDLSHNRLPELPDNLHALARLELLNLGQNPLTKIPAGIIYMNGLKHLKIDGKTINQLDHYASFKEDLRDKIREGEERWSAWEGLWPKMF